MYLNYLNANEKMGFLKLAHAIAYADGNFCENEKIIIASYCNEMGVDNIAINSDEISVDKISQEFNSMQSRKVVILELISIVKADGIYDDSEKEIIEKLINNFNIDNEFVEEVFKWSNSMYALIEYGNNLIQQ